MLTATDARAALRATTADAVERTADLFDRLHGTPEARRFAMLDGVPALIGYYADGTSTLAADLYQDQRDNVLGAGGYQAKTVVLDRTVKIRRAIAWSAITSRSHALPRSSSTRPRNRSGTRSAETGNRTRKRSDGSGSRPAGASSAGCSLTAAPSTGSHRSGSRPTLTATAGHSPSGARMTRVRPRR
jgi:hypothetical protein